MPEDFIQLKTPLRLIGFAYGRVNAQEMPDRTSIKDKLVQPCTFSVPEETLAVHVSFRSVDMFFGNSPAPEARRVKSVYFEITEEDYSQLSNGVFKCKVYAHLEGPAADDEWTPFFILQVMCFGK
ncbi:MAG: hypothetical protein HY914_14075 [Desulfomonile tiedjei]|nr:hypothetical protein [Desulfomonile tiedjei]